MESLTKLCGFDNCLNCASCLTYTIGIAFGGLFLTIFGMVEYLGISYTVSYPDADGWYGLLDGNQDTMSSEEFLKESGARDM